MQENIKPPRAEVTEEDKIKFGEEAFQVKNHAQMELIEMAGGDEVAPEWIATNAKKFNELVYDPRFNFIERLADEKTHDEALEDLKQRLYH